MPWRPSPRSGLLSPILLSIPMISARSPRACATPTAMDARPLPRAFATGDDEDFHDWRKTLQHHWRHMQLLTPCWPSELSARAELARGLSQILGDDHDISLIQQLVSAPTLVFASPEDTVAFMKQCRERQKELRQEARNAGRETARRAVATVRGAHRGLLAKRSGKGEAAAGRRPAQQCRRLRRRERSPPVRGHQADQSPRFSRQA